MTKKTIAPNERTKAQWAAYLKADQHDKTGKSNPSLKYYLSKEYRASIKATNKVATGWRTCPMPRSRPTWRPGWPMAPRIPTPPPVATDAAMSGNSWRAGLRADLQAVFVEQWSPYLGMTLLVTLLTALMISGQFWGIFGGLKLWGDWFNQLIGLGKVLGIKSELESPLMHRMSLMNLALILGAFAAACLAGQFALHRAPKLEYVWGALGGSLMGIGAALAGGCTTGGFFTPIVHSSPAGWAMGLGLIVGAVIGLKLLLWTLEHFQWGTQAPATGGDAFWLALRPWIGLFALAAALFWTASWAHAEDARLVTRSILIAVGFGFGFVMQRARLCFARGFREPFMTAEGEMTKAILWGLALAMPIAALIFEKKLLDPFVAIPPTFWFGSLTGGLLFGIGMIFAGGCASGALWRMGEGHLKLWVAGFFFAWSGSTFSAIARRWDLLTAEQNIDTMLDETRVGAQVHLPLVLDGWGWALLLSFALLALWYLFVRYNESTEKFTVL